MIERIIREGHEYKEGMKIFYMMIGLPASGKSTVAERICRESNAVLCSSDKIREELSGDESIQGNNKVVFDIMHERAQEALKAGRSVVYDATNLSSKRRAATINHTIGKINCRKVAYVVLADFKECRRRNNERKRTVPEAVMDRMLKQFNFPWWFEGWDEIVVERTDDKLYLMQDLLIPLMNIEHENPHHHNETIGEHLFVVARSKEMNTPFLKNVALLHDVGKGYCKTFTDSKGNPTTDAHYYGHDSVSAYMSLMVKDRLPLEKKAKRAVLIQNHMAQFTRDEKGLKKLESNLGFSMFDMLTRLFKADLERDDQYERFLKVTWYALNFFLSWQLYF